MRISGKWALPAILAGLTISFFALGYFNPYYRRADQDVVLAYQGLLFNDGGPQSFFDHTGYITYLTLGAWYQALHTLGLLPVYAFSQVPGADNVEGFTAAWQGAVRAGRIFSLLLSAVFAISFFHLVRKFFRDERIATVATFALVFTDGFMAHARTIRTELWSGFFVTMALLLMLNAARARQLPRALMLVGVGLCAALAIEEKVQAILPLLALPAIGVAFGAPIEDRREAHGWAPAAALGLLAAITAPAAATILQIGFEPIRGAIPYPPLGLPPGLYQAAFLAWPCAAAAAYVWIWRIPLAVAASSFAGLALGAALGVFVLLIRYHPQNILAFTHPIEHMFVFAAVTRPELGAHVIGQGLVLGLAHGLLSSLALHSLVLKPTWRATLISEWFAIGAAVVAWRRGARLVVLQVALLIVSAWLVDAVFYLRDIKMSYAIYTDPLLVLAGACMLAQFPGLFVAQRARRWAMALAVIAIISSQSEAAKWTLSRKRPGENSCSWLPHYVPGVPRFPFCPA
jgi:hypothetical protein